MPAITLRTDIPGPRSRELMRRRLAAVPRGVSHATPVFAAAAAGATITDVDGNVFLDFAGGIGVMNVGHSQPAVVAAVAEQTGAVHPHRFLGGAVRILRLAGGAARGDHARIVSEEDALRERRRRGGRERREDRAARHRTARRAGLRGRLSRPHAVLVVDDQQGHALQDRLRTLCRRRAPRAVRLLLSLRLFEDLPGLPVRMRRVHRRAVPPLCRSADDCGAGRRTGARRGRIRRAATADT